MSITQALNDLGGILGPIGFMVAVIFGTLYGRKKAEQDKSNDTVAIYEKNAQAQKELLQTRDQELSEARLKHDSNVLRIRDLETKANILENQITQAPSIAELTLQIGKQHKAMMGEISKMTKELGNIAKALPTVVQLDRLEKR